jgi:hypothetical protein
MFQVGHEQVTSETTECLIGEAELAFRDRGPPPV